MDHDGLDDPRAVDILTTEHWSLLSARALGYQEMFGRATIFVSILSGTVVALALLAQAAHFGRGTLWFALPLLGVTLFIGLATFRRSVEINYEDARWIEGMRRLRSAYVEIVPAVRPFLLPDDARHPAGALGHGMLQRMPNFGSSLTTTSSVAATLNSMIVGALVSDIGILSNLGTVTSVAIGVALSIVSGILHARHAARFRQRHDPSAP
jgi:hypothetical protein